MKSRFLFLAAYILASSLFLEAILHFPRTDDPETGVLLETGVSLSRTAGHIPLPQALKSVKARLDQAGVPHGTQVTLSLIEVSIEDQHGEWWVSGTSIDEVVKAFLRDRHAMSDPDDELYGSSSSGGDAVGSIASHRKSEKTTAPDLSWLADDLSWLADHVSKSTSGLREDKIRGLTTESMAKPQFHFQFTVYQQEGLTCGYHAVFNALAMQRVFSEIFSRDKLHRYAEEYHDQIKTFCCLEHYKLQNLAKKNGLKNYYMLSYHQPTKKIGFTDYAFKSDVEIALEKFKTKDRGIMHFICNTCSHWITICAVKYQNMLPQLILLDSLNYRVNPGAIEAEFLRYLDEKLRPKTAGKRETKSTSSSDDDEK